MPAFYYETLSLGRWNPRVTNLNRPMEGPFIRSVIDIPDNDIHVHLTDLWLKHSPDSPRNQKDPPAGGVPAENPPPTTSPSSSAAEPEVNPEESGWAEKIVAPYVDPR